MKKYIKNKNFIPQSFYEKAELSEGKNENKILIMLLILNLILLPINLNQKSELEKKSAQNEKLISYTEKNDFNITHINSVIERVFSEDISEASINNDNGKITIDKLEKLNGLNKDDFININEIKQNSNKEYEIGVVINEKSN